jgi:hypothetical protein
VDEECKLIAQALKIPFVENGDGCALFSSPQGSEVVYTNKKHSVIGNIFYLIEIDKDCQLKEIVFIDCLLNLIVLIKSKKYTLKNNSVFVVINNPTAQLGSVLDGRFSFRYKYLLAYPNTIQGKIQVLKTILFLLKEQEVRVSYPGNNFIVHLNDKERIIDINVTIQRLIRDFNRLKYNISAIPFGRNIYNLKQLYGYRD